MNCIEIVLKGDVGREFPGDFEKTTIARAIVKFLTAVCLGILQRGLDICQYWGPGCMKRLIHFQVPLSTGAVIIAGPHRETGYRGYFKTVSTGTP